MRPPNNAYLELTTHGWNGASPLISVLDGLKQSEAARRTGGMTGHLGVRLALPFALFLGIAEVVRNWGDWGFWPFWVVDYIAVGLLACGWHAARRGRPGALSLLAGAWGFTCSMFYMSFFSHLANVERPDRGPIEHRSLTVIIGMLFGVTVLGFASTLSASRAGTSRSGGSNG